MNNKKPLIHRMQDDRVITQSSRTANIKVKRERERAVFINAPSLLVLSTSVSVPAIVASSLDICVCPCNRVIMFHWVRSRVDCMRVSSRVSAKSKVLRKVMSVAARCTNALSICTCMLL